MMEISTNISVSKDAPGAIKRANERLLMDAADAGFATSQDRVPVDQGTLLQSGVPPTMTRDGAVIWGYNAPYALDVEQGQEPNFIEDIEPLKGWARRVLGDESAAYAVRAKIAEKGTDPQPYAKPGAEAMQAFATGGKISQYIEEEL